MTVRRSLAWAFSGQFTTFFIQFVASVIVARLLSPRETGIYAIAIATLGLISSFTTFGIGPYVVRENELTHDTLDSAFTVNAIISVFLSSVLMIISFAAEPLLGVAEAAPVLRVVALSGLLGIVTFCPAAMMQREMRFKQLSIIGITGGLVQSISTIAFALAGSSYMSPAYASLTTGMVTGAMTMIFGRDHIRLKLSRSSWRPIMAFGVRMMMVSGVANLAGRFTELLLGRLLGVVALGLYSRAGNLAGQMWGNLYGTATGVMFTQLSKEYRERGPWQDTYVRSLSIMVALMWPILLGSAVLSRPLVYNLYGDRWLAAAPVLSLLLVAQIFGVAFGMNWELFLLRGEQARQARYEIARMVIGVPLFALGCYFSLYLATSMKVVEAVLGLILYYPHVRRLAEIGPGVVPTVYRDGALLTLVAVLPSTALMTAYHWSYKTPVPFVVGAVVLGISLWIGLIVVIGHPLRDEFRVVWRRLAPSRTAP